MACSVSTALLGRVGVSLMGLNSSARRGAARPRSPRQASTGGRRNARAPILDTKRPAAAVERNSPTRRALAQPPRLLQAPCDRSPRADPRDPLQAVEDDPFPGLLQ